MKQQRHWKWTLGALASLGLLAGAACSSDSGGGGSSDDLDDQRRYEPNERLDFNNVAVFNQDGIFHDVNDTGRGGMGAGEKDIPYYGGMPEDIPGGYPEEAPKSGFRLVYPRIQMEPYQELNFCMAWEVPDIAHYNIYNTEFYAGPGVHHANMFAVEKLDGGQPYPECVSPDAAGSISFGQAFDAIFASDITLFKMPVVLFANSTQVVGGEHFTHPEGHALKIKEGMEVIIDIHFLNPTDDTLVVEGLYDFYTMPDEQVEHEAVAFVWFWMDFNIPPHSDHSVTADCEWGGQDLPDATINAIMPHTHEWATAFQVDMVKKGADNAVTASDTIYFKEGIGAEGGGGTEGDIQSYNPAVNASGVNSLKFTCSWYNPFDHSMRNGIGENEMCFLFGYTSPPEAQSAGTILTEGAPCWSWNVGRPDKEIERGWKLADALAELEPDVLAKVLDMFTDFGR